MKTSISRYLVALLMATFVLVGAADLFGQEDAKSALTMARKEEKGAVGKKGDDRRAVLEKALARYREIPTRFPEARVATMQAMLSAGELEAKLGRVEQALVAFDGALEVGADDNLSAKALTGKSTMLRRLKRMPEAEAALRQLVEDHPSQESLVVDARLRLGKMAKKAERWDEAVAEAEKILADHAGDWRGNVDAANLAISVLIERREWVKALDALARYDERLVDRFEKGEDWDKVDRAMKRMSTRKMLTPIGD